MFVLLGDEVIERPTAERCMVGDQETIFLDGDGGQVATYPTELVIGYSTDPRRLVIDSRSMPRQQKGRNAKRGDAG